jgi:hypothetical protein
VHNASSHPPAPARCFAPRAVVSRCRRAGPLFRRVTERSIAGVIAIGAVELFFQSQRLGRIGFRF